MSRTFGISNNNITRVVVLVLENHQGDILITQRKDNVHLAGYWEFPGGKIESNESLHTALKRECMEELDYIPSNPSHILTVKHRYPNKHVMLEIFHEIKTNPEVYPVEGQQMRWVRPEKLSKFQLPEANTIILDYLNQNPFQQII